MIAVIKADPRLAKPDDPPDVLTETWGYSYNNDLEKTGENVVVSLFNKSRTAKLAGTFREASGIPVILNAIPEYAIHFENKVLDYSEDRWFFLRDPDPAG
jgi:hypothetical protein